VEFSYDLVAYEGDDGVAETTLVSGNWDAEVLAYHVTDKQRQVIVRGLLPGEVVHVMLVNDSALADAVAKDVSIVSVPSDELDEGDGQEPGPPDDEPPFPDGPGSNDGEGSAACACRESEPGGTLAALAMILFLASRRRRR
jgi:MYXO-CTERM domain-containing protein